MVIGIKGLVNKSSMNTSSTGWKHDPAVSKTSAASSSFEEPQIFKIAFAMLSAITLAVDNAVKLVANFC